MAKRKTSTNKNPRQSKAKKGNSIKIGISIFIVLLISALSFLYYHLLSNKIHFKKDDKNIIYIKTDDNVDSIIHYLNENSLGFNSFIFKTLTNYEFSVKPGKYSFDENVSHFDLYKRLASGREDVVNIVINKFRTKKQFAAAVSKKLELDSADLMLLLTDNVYLANLGFNGNNILGMFVPNTYEFYWDTDEELFLERMKEEYEKFWTVERRQLATNLDLTPQEVLALAAIVDEESNKNDEKPIIAGLYLNRLRKNMKLESDPTVKFALQNFALRRISNEDLQVESPYNTYRNVGLPPGPICTPSIPSVDAVLNAAKHNYIFMCAKEDFSGYHNFAADYETHKQNARKYRAELNRRNILR